MVGLLVTCVINLYDRPHHGVATEHTRRHHDVNADAHDLAHGCSTPPQYLPGGSICSVRHSLATSFFF